MYVFDGDHEKRRKEQLKKLFDRTPEQVEEEQTLLAELRKIELRKKERDRKTQDLQKLITAADHQADPRKNERKSSKKSSSSRNRPHKTDSAHVSSTIFFFNLSFLSSLVLTIEETFFVKEKLFCLKFFSSLLTKWNGLLKQTGKLQAVESAGIKFPDLKNSGVSLRSQRIKLPSSLGQKKMKGIEQVLTDLNLGNTSCFLYRRKMSDYDYI